MTEVPLAGAASGYRAEVRSDPPRLVVAGPTEPVEVTLDGEASWLPGTSGDLCVIRIPARVADDVPRAIRNRLPRSVRAFVLPMQPDDAMVLRDALEASPAKRLGPSNEHIAGELDARAAVLAATKRSTTWWNRRVGTVIAVLAVLGIVLAGQTASPPRGAQLVATLGYGAMVLGAIGFVAWLNFGLPAVARLRGGPPPFRWTAIIAFTVLAVVLLAALAAVRFD